MQRRLHAITLALVMLACAWSAGSHRAAAQPSNCCTYTVDIAGISSECLPITIEGDFGPGGRDTVTLTGDTVMIRAVPGIAPASHHSAASRNAMARRSGRQRISAGSFVQESGITGQEGFLRTDRQTSTR